MKLLCQEQLLPSDSILGKWEFAASAGFDGIRDCAKTVPPQVVRRS